MFAGQSPVQWFPVHLIFYIDVYSGSSYPLAVSTHFSSKVVLYFKLLTHHGAKVHSCVAN